METQCSHCKAGFKAPNHYEGKKVTCPKCKQLFIVTNILTTKIQPSKIIHSAPLEDEVVDLVETLERVLEKITNYDDDDIAEAQLMLRRAIAKYEGGVA